MDDIHDLDTLTIVFIDDPFCMCSSIWGSSFGCEEYYDILLIWIDRISQSDDIFFYDIVWLSIYRYDDNMFDIFSSFYQDCILTPVFFF